MPQITIHRGAHTIGGSCIEVNSNGCRILLDVGMPLMEKGGAEIAPDKLENPSIDNGILPDVKGLYKKARAGEIKNFTGVDTVFEPMENAEVEVKTNKMSAADAVEKIMHYVLPYISMQDIKE